MRRSHNLIRALRTIRQHIFTRLDIVVAAETQLWVVGLACADEIGPIVYRISGSVRLEDGERAAFTVAIAAPEASGLGDSICCVSCPFLDASPFTIYGVDHEQALQLSRRFIESNLEHMNAYLVDAEGRRVELPSVPPVSG